MGSCRPGKHVAYGLVWSVQDVAWLKAKENGDWMRRFCIFVCILGNMDFVAEFRLSY